MGVLESDDYRREQELLQADPIVRAMYREMKEDIDSGALSRHEMSGYEFMCSADEEYRSRGGQDARTIGGVARALRALAASS